MTRLFFVILVILLSGCVSQPSQRFQSDNFDQQEAAKNRISLGLTYLKNGNYQQAKANLDKALEYAPRMADAHYSVAYYYQLVGDNQRADASFREALDYDPRNADIANSYGAFLCQVGRYEESIQQFKKALNNPQYAGSAETYENMAICANSDGQTEQAIELLQKALNYQPGRLKSLLLLAELYIGSQQWELAQRTLETYQKLGRVSADSLFLLAEVGLGQNDVNKAKGYGDMLTSLYPDSPLVAIYQKRLRAAEQELAELAKTQTASNKGKADGVAVKRQQQLSPSNAAKPNSSSSANSEALTQTTPTAETTQNPLFHIVERGESLFRISLRYNIKVARLQEWNGLTDAGNIFAGKKLWLVPPKDQQ